MSSTTDAGPNAGVAVRSLPFFQSEGNEVVEATILSGGLQNTNFKVVTASGATFVVRIPAPDAAEHGQDQSVVYANAAAAADAGIAPTAVAFDAPTGVIVTQFVDGTVLTPDVVKSDPAMLARFVAAAKKLHESGVSLATSRASDVIDGYPIDGLADLLPGNAVPPRAHELQRLLARSLGAFDAVVGCHNDLTPTNCIVRPDGEAVLIDWEWSGPFDIVHDLAKLVLLCELDAAGGDRVLELYFGRDAVKPIHRARMSLWHLHTTSREALWCHAKVQHPSAEDAAAADGHDYAAEGRRCASDFASQLASPETASLMALLDGALDGGQ